MGQCKCVVAMHSVNTLYILFNISVTLTDHLQTDQFMAIHGGGWSYMVPKRHCITLGCVIDPLPEFSTATCW